MLPTTDAFVLNDAGSYAGSDSLAAVISDSIAATWKLNGWEAVQAGDGVMISILGITIVVAALVLITYVIKLLKVYAVATGPKAEKKGDVQVQTANELTGEVVAAISLALQMHMYELHDEERTVLTISKVSRPYSPWSSKLHTMTPFPSNPIPNP